MHIKFENNCKTTQFLVLGSCVIYWRGERRRLSPVSVSITGTMRGLIAAFTITQEFRHDQSGPCDVGYIVPRNNDLCIYDTVFYVGDEVIQTQLEEKDGQTTFFDVSASPPECEFAEGIREFRIANVDNTVPVRIEVKVCVWCRAAEPDCLVVKLPMYACSTDAPSAMFTKIVSSLTLLSFEFDFKSRKELVSDVKLNVNAEIDLQQASIKCHDKPETATLEILMKHQCPIVNECIGCGKYMSVSMFGQESVGSPENDEFVFIIDERDFYDEWASNIREAVCIGLSALPAGAFFEVRVCRRSYTWPPRKPRPLDRKDVIEDIDEWLSAFEQKHLCCRYDYQLIMNLGMVLDRPLLGKCRCRQCFVLTSGMFDYDDLEAILETCNDNSSCNRIFAFALRDSPDHASLTCGHDFLKNVKELQGRSSEAMSDLTGGHCVYVENGDDLAELLMRELETSLACSICDVTIDVDGHDNIEMTGFSPMHIDVNGLSHYVLKSGSEFENEQLVHVRGHCGDQLVDIPLTCELVQDHEPDTDSFRRLLCALYSHQRIQMLERRIASMSSSDAARETIVREVVMLSKESGVLSFYTSFVDAVQVNLTFDDLMDFTATVYSLKKTKHVDRRVIGRRMTGDSVRTERRIGPRTILIQQNENGAWNSEVIKLVAKLWDGVPSIPVIEQLGELEQDVLTSIKSTVLAIALLRRYFGAHPAIFHVAERRGLSYLTNVSKSTDWQSAIQQLVSKLQ